MVQTEISARGVTVEKTIEARGDVAICEFTITTTWEHPVAVTLVDPIPIEVPADDIAVESPGAWVVRDSFDLVWSETVRPDEEIETAYGVGIPSDESIALFDRRPRIDAVQPASEEVGRRLWRSASSRPVTNTLSGSGSGDAGTDPGDWEGAEDSTDEDGSETAELETESGPAEAEFEFDFVESDDADGSEPIVDRYRLEVSIASDRRERAGSAVVHGLANGTALIDSTPSERAICDGSFEGPIELIVESALEHRLIRDSLEPIDGVRSVSVQVLETNVDASRGVTDASETRRRFEALRETTAVETDSADSSSLEAQLAGAVFDPDRGIDAATGPEGHDCDRERERNHDTITIDALLESADANRETTLESGEGSEPGRIDADDVDVDGSIASRNRTRIGPDELLETLLVALEEGDDDRTAAIREALGVDPRPTDAKANASTSTSALEARVDHLHARTETVLAYEEGLAGVLDEYGAGDDGPGPLEELADRLDRIERTVADLEADVDRLAGDGTARDERVDAVETELETLEDDLAVLETEVEAVAEWRERVANVF